MWCRHQIGSLFCLQGTTKHHEGSEEQEHFFHWTCLHQCFWFSHILTHQNVSVINATMLQSTAMQLYCFKTTQLRSQMCLHRKYAHSTLLKWRIEQKTWHLINDMTYDMIWCIRRAANNKMHNYSRSHPSLIGPLCPRSYLSCISNLIIITHCKMIHYFPKYSITVLVNMLLKLILPM